ncbi:MAG TPA: hypothetical protein ACHBZ9_17255 [Arsenophonus nasoniae]|uniref:hypothetical protein n=1 Tax=Arsenophonus nasoniae TaxID=638 RepID=UPI00387A7C28
MKNNVIDIQSGKEVLQSLSVEKRKNNFKIHLNNVLNKSLHVSRYVLAVALYIVVCAPLVVIAALSFLITTLGAFIAMGVTIFYWCGGAVDGYLVILFWVVIGIAHNAEEILKWWIESRAAFRFFRLIDEV